MYTCIAIDNDVLLENKTEKYNVSSKVYTLRHTSTFLQNHHCTYNDKIRHRNINIDFSLEHLNRYSLECHVMKSDVSMSHPPKKSSI